VKISSGSSARSSTGCARHGISGISPWRDQVAEFGLEQDGALHPDARLDGDGAVSGRILHGKGNWLDDNRRAIR